MVMASREEAAVPPPSSAPSPSSAASPAASPAQNGPARQLERIASIPVVNRGDGSGALPCPRCSCHCRRCCCCTTLLLPADGCEANFTCIPYRAAQPLQTTWRSDTCAMC